MVYRGRTEGLVRRFMPQPGDIFGVGAEFEDGLRRADAKAYGVAVSILKNGDDAREAVGRAYGVIARHPRQPETWEEYERILCFTTKQQSLTMLRSAQVRREIPAEGDSLAEPDDQPVLTEVIVRDRAPFIREAVTRLPPRERQVVVLKYFHDKEFEEIAEIMGVSVGAVCMLHHKAKQRLKTSLAPVA
jgi:RNA polymerase sigma factor (sigma-70 family)